MLPGDSILLTVLIAAAAITLLLGILGMLRAVLLWYWKIDRIVMLLEQLVRESAEQTLIATARSAQGTQDHNP